MGAAIKRAIKRRGGLLRVRTIKADLGGSRDRHKRGGQLLRVHIVRRAGKRGGHSIVTRIKSKHKKG